MSHLYCLDWSCGSHSRSFMWSCVSMYYNLCWSICTSPLFSSSSHKNHMISFFASYYPHQNLVLIVFLHFLWIKFLSLRTHIVKWNISLSPTLLQYIAVFLRKHMGLLAIILQHLRSNDLRELQYDRITTCRLLWADSLYLCFRIRCKVDGENKWKPSLST